jgi:hypothetical protein
VSTTPADPSFIALQSAVAGRFSLESELGRGGMGIVYLARDVLLERPVAIKLLAPALAAREDMRRRFLREARLAAQCFHPNIVPIHEVAEAGDLAWFVMAYVPGESLADRLRRAGPLPAEEVRRIGREIGWALAYAHERGVVHRDVKPENILLEQGSDRALIADFGIAVAANGPHHSGEVAGTARYMAPEQALGEPIDGRADLYALGVTLYVAATGAYPFDGASSVAILAQQSTTAALPVRERAPRLPVQLADAIDQCVAVRVSERFDSAARFVHALERTPDGGELPNEARATRYAISSAMSLVDWTLAMAYAGLFLVMGEPPQSFGRNIMIGIVEAGLLFIGTATAVRVGEAVLAARTALRRGVAPRDVVEALAPPPAAPDRPVGFLQGIGLLIAGSSLALAQAQIDPLGLPSALELLGNLITWVAPPLLIHRATTGMRHPNGQSGWLYPFVRRPLAQRIVRWLGGTGARDTTPALSASPSHTEVLLSEAVNAIFERLPRDVRLPLAALPDATAALAREALALRARAEALSAEHRRLRTAPHDAAMLADIEQQQATVRARLGTAIAGLENIRLDLLRLEADRTLPGSLTEQLEAVRELQRQVDAAAEMQRILRAPATELTPV